MLYPALHLALVVQLSCVQAVPKNPSQATESVAQLELWLKTQDVSEKAALTLPDESGMRLTHWAASGGNVEVLKLLASKGADPWDGAATPEERSCLHMACQSGHVNVLEYMLSEEGLKKRSRGAYTEAQAVNALDKRGVPCIHLAALAGQAEVIVALGGAGADITTSTDKYGTALHAAAAAGQLEAVEALLKLHADPCAKNAKGKTPGSRAEEEEHEEVAKILLAKEEQKGCRVKKVKKEQKKKKDKKNKKSDL